VLRLQDYRSRRERRFDQALALYSADRERALLLRYLWSAVSVASGDRAAVVWVDEYGPGLVHGHVILDLSADRPRRAFLPEPLRLAWSEGVPGIYDASGREAAPGLFDAGAYRSVCAVALGSDGLRAWFVVVDGQTPRPRLTPEATAEMMFLAGECSAILMHRDMKRSEETVLLPEGGVERFAAWPILKDIEGHEKEEELNRRISCRFLVARVVRAILDDDLATDRGALDHQIECVRRELGRQFVEDPERPLWEAVLDAADTDDRVAFAKSVLALGSHVEELNHLSGARELYRSAYEAAMAVGAEEEALEAARFAGRAWRRGSEWDRAVGWYQVARALAVAVGDVAREALVLDGAAKVYKERGNLPRARQLLDEALKLALESGSPYAIGATYHDLGAVAAMARCFEEAIRMTWLAVRHYETDQDRLSALALLANILTEAGELDAAESAYAVVARRVKSSVYRLYALSGYAKVAGLRGQRVEFERRIAVLEGAGFHDGPAAFKAGAWIDRGEVYGKFRNTSQARRCFEYAVELAEAHRLGQFLIQAEEAIRCLESSQLTERELPATSSYSAIEDIREELVRMRDQSPVLAGV
jgi:tetratricopeptide (TPR) repeat protein